MYFLMIRPQRRRMREQQALQSSLEVGDEVHHHVGHLRLHHRLRGRQSLARDRRRRADPRRPGAIQGKVDTSGRRTSLDGPTKGAEPSKDAADATPTRRRRRRRHARRMRRRRLWASLLGFVGITVAPADLQPGLRQHPGPRSRPAGRRVGDPRADRGRDGRRPDRHPRPDPRRAREPRHRRARRARRGLEHHRRPARRQGPARRPRRRRRRRHRHAAAGVRLRSVEETTGASVPSSVPDSGPDDDGRGIRRRRARRRRRPAALDLDVTDDHGGTSGVRQPQTPHRRRPSRPRPSRPRPAHDDLPAPTTTTVPGATTTSTVAAAQPEPDVLRQLGGGSVPRRSGRAQAARTSSSATAPSVELVPAVRLGRRRRPQPRRARRRGTPSPCECNTGAATCPSRQLAIVLDDVMQSAPIVNQPSFTDSVQITGSFTEGEARSLARVLNRGAFPTDVEVRRVDTVSPTLGEDSMRASIVAGLVGIVLAADPADRSSTGASRCSSPPGWSCGGC